VGETEVLRENMFQHHFVHHKSHMTCLFTSYILYYCLDIPYDTLQKATCAGNINPLCRILQISAINIDYADKERRQKGRKVGEICWNCYVSVNLSLPGSTEKNLFDYFK
jgi:hypothetical protein